MFKKITLMLFALVLLISMVGCSNNPAPEAKPASTNEEVQENQAEAYPVQNQQLLPIISGKAASLLLDSTADGTTQQLKVGDVIDITLESNPSTGYAWYATSANPEIVAQLGEAQYQEPKTSSGEPKLGALGTEVLYFEAKGTGTTTLILDYKRGWETDIAPEKTITITVEVEE